MRRLLIPALLALLAIGIVAARRGAVVRTTAAQEPDALAQALLVEAAALEPARAGPAPFERLLRADPDSALAYLRANGSDTDQRQRLMQRFAEGGRPAEARAVLDLAPEGSLRDVLRATLAPLLPPSVDPIAFADSIASPEQRLVAYLEIAVHRRRAADALNRAVDLVQTMPLGIVPSRIGGALARLSDWPEASMRAAEFGT